MASATIEQQVGAVLAEALTDLARSGIRSSAQLEAEEFAHVTDAQHRQTLARVYYGAGWQYRVGLLLLASGEERATHVRAQIIDYASVVEGILSDAVAHAIRYGFTLGEGYRFSNPAACGQLINWRVKDIDGQVGRQSLFWLIAVSGQFEIIPAELSGKLDELRKERNKVHLRQHTEIGQVAYTNQSKKAFELAEATITATKSWKSTHPAPRA